MTDTFIDGLWYTLGLSERYEYISDLGKGSFGMVKRYQDIETGCDVAFKTVDLKESPGEYMEVQILKMLSKKHPAFLVFNNATIHKDTLTIITEVAPGEELFKRLNEGISLTVPQVKSAFRQLLEAMNIAHDLKIIHLDLKPENIMLFESEDGTISVKILDWGLALVGRQRETVGGSPNYVAPEILKKNANIGSWNDVWSLGVILYTMITRQMPFDQDTFPLLFRQIWDMRVEYTTPGLTPGAVDILKKIFIPYDSRATCQDLLGEKWLSDDRDEARI